MSEATARVDVDVRMELPVLEVSATAILLEGVPDLQVIPEHRSRWRTSLGREVASKRLLTVTVTRHRVRRSNAANAYLWGVVYRELLTELRIIAVVHPQAALPVRGRSGATRGDEIPVPGSRGGGDRRATTGAAEHHDHLGHGAIQRLRVQHQTHGRGALANLHLGSRMTSASARAAVLGPGAQPSLRDHGPPPHRRPPVCGAERVRKALPTALRSERMRVDVGARQKDRRPGESARAKDAAGARCSEHLTREVYHEPGRVTPLFRGGGPWQPDTGEPSRGLNVRMCARLTQPKEVSTAARRGFPGNGRLLDAGGKTQMGGEVGQLGSVPRSIGWSRKPCGVQPASVLLSLSKRLRPGHQATPNRTSYKAQASQAWRVANVPATG